MKKGGIREVNSFISVAGGGPSTRSSRESVTKTSKNPPSTTSKVKINAANRSTEATSNVKEPTGIKRVNDAIKQLTPRQKVDSNLMKVRRMEEKPSSLKSITPVRQGSRSTLQAQNKMTDFSSRAKLKYSIAEENRAISSHKFTMDEVYKRRLSVSSVEKFEPLSRRSSSSSISTPRAAEIIQEEDIASKHADSAADAEKAKPLNKDADDDFEYDDDFEDYESSFESYSGSSDSLHQDETAAINCDDQKVIVEEEKKMDSGSYDLTYRRQLQKEKNQLDMIKEALQKENTALQSNYSNETLIRDGLPTGHHTSAQNSLLLDFNLKSMQSFSNIKKKQQNSKTARMIKARGEKLLQMITLDTMSFVFYDRPSIPYDVFMRSYARKNTQQAYTQTNEDSLSSETQTEEIQDQTKWTQFPIRISKDLLQADTNFLQMLTGVGDENRDSLVTSSPKVNIQKLNYFMKTFGEEMMAVLEENLHEEEISSSDNKEVATEISSYVSRIKYSKLEFLKAYSVLLMSYDPQDSSRLLTVHQATDKSKEEANLCILCIWNIHQPWKPKMILKSYGNVSSACFASSDSSFVVAGHDDGSLCVWNLRENILRPQHNGMDFVSPSYNTAEVLKTDNHKSKVVQIDAIKRNSDDSSKRNLVLERKSEMVCSVEEENVLIMWTLSENLSQSTDIGSAPWSRIKFFVNQTIDVAQMLPKTVFRTSIMKVLSEYHVLLGTTAGFVLKCSLCDRKFKKFSKDAFNNSNDHRSMVTSMEICPYNRNYIAVGYSNGDILVFNVNYTVPVSKIVYRGFSLSNATTVQWLWNKQDYILVLDSSAKLAIYRVQTESCILLLHKKLVDDVCSMLVSPFLLSQQRDPYFVLLTNTEVQVHKLHSLEILEHAKRKEFTQAEVPIC